MSKELKAVPAIIRRDAGHVNEQGERMMAVTFYLPADRLQDFLDVGHRECTIVVPEAKPVRPCDCVNAPEGSPDCRYCGPVKPCTERHGHPDPAYMCMAPEGHR